MRSQRPPDVEGARLERRVIVAAADDNHTRPFLAVVDKDRRRGAFSGAQADNGGTLLRRHRQPDRTAAAVEISGVVSEDFARAPARLDPHLVRRAVRTDQTCRPAGGGAASRGEGWLDAGKGDDLRAREALPERLRALALEAVRDPQGLPCVVRHARRRRAAVKAPGLRCQCRDNGARGVGIEEARRCLLVRCARGRVIRGNCGGRDNGEERASLGKRIDPLFRGIHHLRPARSGGPAIVDDHGKPGRRVGERLRLPARSGKRSEQQRRNQQPERQQPPGRPVRLGRRQVRAPHQLQRGQPHRARGRRRLPQDEVERRQQRGGGEQPWRREAQAAHALSCPERSPARMRSVAASCWCVPWRTVSQPLAEASLSSFSRCAFHAVR